MSRAVEEYEINVTRNLREYNFILPKNSLIIHIGLREINAGYDTIFFTALFDPFEEEEEQRRFLVLESGEEIRNKDPDLHIFFIGAVGVEEQTLYVFEKRLLPSRVMPL